MVSATILMIFTLVLFLLGCTIFPLSDVATIFTTVTAIIATFAIWFQMKREHDIDEAEFIMNYNTSFIENEEFVRLEHVLEEYRKCVESGADTAEAEKTILEYDTQVIVNYLVYHEALAVFVRKRVLDLSSIDDLFAYRFFLIANNPVIQRIELCPEAQYYHGCFWMHNQWTKYRRKRNLYILMEETSLEKTDVYSKFI